MKRKKFVLTDFNHLGAIHFCPFATHVWDATHTLGTPDLIRKTNVGFPKHGNIHEPLRKIWNGLHLKLKLFRAFTNLLLWSVHLDTLNNYRHYIC